MATIRWCPFLSPVAVDTNSELLISKGGRSRSPGAGAATWFSPLGTAQAEVPLEDLSFGSIVRGLTSDRQEITLQIALVVRMLDVDLAARRLDFAIDHATGSWTGSPLQAVRTRIVERIRQIVTETVGRVTLEKVIAIGFEQVGTGLAAGLENAADLTAVGIAVLEARVLSLRADEDVERAFQTVTREAVQAEEADRATYERRAQAVERERAIKENELNNRTELARRQAELVELEGGQRAPSHRTDRAVQPAPRRVRTGGVGGQAGDPRRRGPGGDHRSPAPRPGRGAPRDRCPHRHARHAGQRHPEPRRRRLGVSAPRLVVVHRRTELEELLARHATLGAVEFFLAARGQAMAPLQEADRAQRRTLEEVVALTPGDWRSAVVERSMLSRFLFEADDLIVVVGQDGLVANVAKYLVGQPVAGINPSGAGGLAS